MEEETGKWGDSNWGGRWQDNTERKRKGNVFEKVTGIHILYSSNIA